jgi:hypothetical protein
MHLILIRKKKRSLKQKQQTALFLCRTVCSLAGRRQKAVCYICQNPPVKVYKVFNYTNILNGFERKDPSVRFPVTMTNIFLLTPSKRFDKHIRSLPQVKMWVYK